MDFSYEKDRLQCTALTKDGTRCRLVGTHSNEQGVLCQRHHTAHQKAKVQPRRG